MITQMNTEIRLREYTDDYRYILICLSSVVLVCCKSVLICVIEVCLS